MYDNLLFVLVNKKISVTDELISGAVEITRLSTNILLTIYETVSLS